MRSMVRALIGILRTDLAIWIRRPVVVVVTILPALGLIVIVLVSAQAVDRIPVALVVLDDGPQATRLAQLIQTSDAFTVERTNAERASTLLQEVQVLGVITVPPGFGRDSQAPRVTIEINNLNVDFTNDLRRSLPAVITKFYQGQADNPIQVTTMETDLRPSDVPLVNFEMIPDLVLLITLAGIINTGLGTAREFENQTVKELALAPVPRSVVIMGKMLAGWVEALIVAGVVLGIAAAAGFLRPEGWYWVPAIGMLMLYALAAAGVGTFLGALLRRTEQVTLAGVVVAVYLFFLSGGLGGGVTGFLPGWVEAVARLIPSFYAVHTLEMSVFYRSTDLVARDMAIVAATVVAAVVAGGLALRRTVAR
jgi:ABC-2 type transport system permease protein